ncbi:X-linked retinitis pigmentosa GTPase regulator [Hondaea fermentalgiana]|uniref:X-linked retinitis pigmentosa GTPase regulator n=1 Tax=Hondaea fermentalgiana TaxID=2315210 RepID=A0A2R5GPX2_9STRA|nr:X-linked retinitis pigmentosa GTPase regulator [Hondaea fermentalgiana]|eukprot:GBG32349.1 X-linked retinitis pigmentosa GTPase regulator [Hondaea fermentalgiana]
MALRTRGLATAATRAATPKRTGVYCRGVGINGALGTGNLEDSEKPLRAKGDLKERIVKVAAGYGHSGALDAKGGAYLFGRTHDATLAVRLGRYAKSSPLMAWTMRHFGAEKSVDAPQPREVVSFKVFGEPIEHEVEESSRKIGVKAPFEGFSTESMRDIVCGAGVTAFISSTTDTLFMLGSNMYGQCAIGMPDAYLWEPRTTVGLPANDDAVASVALGFRHGVLATKGTGKVYTWGKGQRGQLGNGLRGLEDDAFTMQPVNLPGRVVKVVAGMNSCGALLEDGRVFVWGKMQSLEIDTAKHQYEDQILPREVTFKDDLGPIVDLWAGQQSFVAMAKGEGAKHTLHQWGMLSDQEKSSAEAVRAQLDPHIPEDSGFWQTVEKNNALARTVVHPVQVLAPFELVSDNEDGKVDVEVSVGHEGFVIVGKDLPTPFRWDWSLRPVPLHLHATALDEFLGSHSVVSIAQGWQHTVLLAAEKEG